jgi:flagellar basal-body rod protein FlgF
MQQGALTGLARQMALERQFDVVANNIANINTTGFKSSSSVFEEYLVAGRDESRFGGTDNQMHSVLDRASYHDFGQGPIEKTGNPLDVALVGDGFIAVQTAGGERYTRNGALQANATGQLVTPDGDAVAGENGPILLQPTDHNVSISADGRITVLEGANTVETLRGKIKLVSFTQPQQLQEVGANLLAAPPGVAAQPATNLHVLQGAIEGSNVNGVLEMTRMIEINRTYSQIASLLQSQDDEHRNSVDKLAQVPS